MAQGMVQQVTFRFGEQRFGVPIDLAVEILPPTDVTPVPTAHEVVAGLMNLRGGIVAVLDVKPLLGLGPVERGGRSMILVVRVNGRTGGILVDEICDVVRFDPASVAPPPGVAAGMADCISGVVTVGETLIALLDLERMFSTDPIGTL